MAISYDVPLVAQTTSMSCWAASIAMILGWKNQQCIPDVLIAANPGGTSYLPSMKSGLDPNDRYILQRNGFMVDEPMCYTEGAIMDRLSAHGPLWVASAVPAPHIRVVCGIDGGQLRINDPGPQNVGSRYIRSVGTFFGRMETLGSQEMGQSAPIYVAYLRDTV